MIKNYTYNYLKNLSLHKGLFSDSKIKLYSYLIYNLGNIIFLLSIPEELVNTFLNFYSVGSMATVILTIYIFSKFLSHINKFIIFNIFIVFFVFLIFGTNIGLYIFYAIFIVILDYFLTQINQEKINILVKSLIALFSILLFFNFIKFELAIIFRAAPALGLIAYFVILDKKLNKIELKNTSIYLFLTNTIYFGSLFLISFYTPSSTVKIWYLTYQLGIGILLRFSDLTIRYKFSNYRIITFITSIVFLIFSTLVFMLNGNIFNYIIYIISLFTLMSYLLRNKNL